MRLTALLCSLISCIWGQQNTVAVAAVDCPPCRCYHYSNDIIANCRNLNLEGIPRNVPNSTTKLYFKGNNIRVLKNETFHSLPSLTYLDLGYCSITDTEAMTFASLHHIKTIDLSNNYYLTFPSFAKALYGLQNSTLEVLKLNAIYGSVGTFVSIKLKDIKLLKKTNLRELHISRNGIIDFEKGFVSCFPSTLRVIVASWNKFYMGPYLLEMTGAKSLRYLDISHLNNHWDALFLQPYNMSRNRTARSVGGLHYPFPPNLKVLLLSHSCLSVYFIGDHVLRNRLSRIDLSYNYISSLRGPVYGLENVNTWDLSNNIIHYIGSTFFSVSQNNSVSHLNLANNLLCYCFDDASCGNAFQNLSHLIHLDISRNRISKVHPLIFKDNAELEVLNISHNNLPTLDVNMEHLRNLRQLDLSYNQLQSLSQHDQIELSTLTNVSISLQGNPLSCDCSNLHFIDWIYDNQDKIHDLDSLTCHLVNGTSVIISNVDTIRSMLQSECRSVILTVALLVGGGVLIPVLMVLLIVYRYRWRIRYFYYAGRTKYAQLAKNDEEEREYIYDAFVSYADEDRSFVKDFMIPELEERAQLKLCIHHRDFVPGEVIASNIVNAIQNSRKTLVVLSPSFLKSHWCGFEYNMARMEGVTRRQNVVLLVLYEAVVMKDMPKDMAVLLSTNCYLEYNTDEYGEVVFWQKLIDAISSFSLLD